MCRAQNSFVDILHEFICEKHTKLKSIKIFWKIIPKVQNQKIKNLLANIQVKYAFNTVIILELNQ